MHIKRPLRRAALLLALVLLLAIPSANAAYNSDAVLAAGWDALAVDPPCAAEGIPCNCYDDLRTTVTNLSGTVTTLQGDLSTFINTTAPNTYLRIDALPTYLSDNGYINSLTAAAPLTVTGSGTSRAISWTGMTAGSVLLASDATTIGYRGITDTTSNTSITSNNTLVTANTVNQLFYTKTQWQTGVKRVNYDSGATTTNIRSLSWTKANALVPAAAGYYQCKILFSFNEDGRNFYASLAQRISDTQITFWGLFGDNGSRVYTSWSMDTNVTNVHRFRDANANTANEAPMPNSARRFMIDGWINTLFPLTSVLSIG